MAADILYLGNIITMEPGHPRARALTVKDGRVQFAGSEDTARALCDDSTVVCDFGDNVIYPGAIEAHCHPDLAGMRLRLEVDLTPGKTMAQYVELMKAFIEENPGAIEYRGAGWSERECKPTAAMLDEICPDIPVVLNSVDAHSLWMNTPALEKYGIDQACIDYWGTDVVRVDDSGKPTGYVSEGPCTEIVSQINYTFEQQEKALLAWQDFAFSHGLTACLHAGMFIEDTFDVYRSLIEKGLWKLRTYAVVYLDEREPDYVGKVQKVRELAERYDNEYFTVIGIKVFMDGVVEAHTAWLCDGYADDPENTGVKRMRDSERVIDLFAAAIEAGYLVHCHTIGDGAVRFAVDCIEAAQKRTGDFTARHALCHLQVVRPEDVRRMADLRIVPVVAPLWTPYSPTFGPQIVEYLGAERESGQYPIASFIEAGAPVAFHTDYPVSTNMGVPRSVYTAVTRTSPTVPGPVQQPDEVISRQQALEALTVNAAYSVKQEAKLGQLAPGFAANMMVFDRDFLADDMEDVATAKLVATVVDGEVVYEG